MLGWHFLAEDRCLQFGNRELIEAGKTYTAVGSLKMCKNGMHACRRALNALSYAPGPVVCHVNLEGELIHDSNKSVARMRRVLWITDATILLHEFALSVATDALFLVEAHGETVDSRSWGVLEVKARWLKGQATNEELTAARAAAWDAAWDAARAAARAAAWDAAWTAAKDAAEGAAWAARDAAWAAYNLQLETMLESLQPND